MRTWIVELAVVGVILATVILFVGSSSAVEWLGAFAALFTFAHSQIADRLAEKEAAKPVPDIECYRWLTIYWVLKEVFWFIYFTIHHSYAALVGVIVFLLYPVWRRLYRKHKSRGQNSTN